MSYAPRRMRVIALIALVTIGAASVGCESWHPVPNADPESREWENRIGKRIRVTTDDGKVTFKLVRVEYPYLYGPEPPKQARRQKAGATAVRINIYEIRRVEMAEINATKTVAFILCITVVVIVIWAAYDLWAHGLYGDDEPFLSK